MKNWASIRQIGHWYYMAFVNLHCWGLGFTLAWVDSGYFYGRVVLGPIDFEIGRDKNDVLE